jgi:hypothetical protein
MDRGTARDVTDAYITGIDGETRRVADGEWGISLDAAGWPLHIGVALRDGLLRAQAEVLGPGRADPHRLLFFNRTLPLVRFAETGAGAVWVLGDLPFAAVTAQALDELLGLVVRVATQAREGVLPATPEGGGAEAGGADSDSAT